MELHPYTVKSCFFGQFGQNFKQLANKFFRYFTKREHQLRAVPPESLFP